MSDDKVYKKCSKCNKLLEATLENFVKQKGGKNNLSSECKICRRERYKKWRENNLSYDKERHLQWNNSHKEHIKEYDRQRYLNDKDNIKKRRKKYDLEHPEGVFNRHNNRRVKTENQGRGITKEQWLDMMNFFNWKCAYSGEPLTNENRTIDHIVSISQGGYNEPYNCVPMKKEYNCSKYTHDMVLWYKKQDFFSQERLEKIYEWISYSTEKYK